MIDMWKRCLGRRVIVDYETSAGTCLFAKGFLDNVDPTLQMILITHFNGERQWFISFSQIRTLNIMDDGDAV